MFTVIIELKTNLYVPKQIICRYNVKSSSILSKHNSNMTSYNNVI